MNNASLLQSMIGAYRYDDVDRTLSPGETMFNDWYFPVGQGAVQAILAGCAASRLQSVGRLLDLPCGHGRVLRHLVKLFPGARLDACDIDRAGVEFCARQFGARPIPSRPELAEVDFGAAYDVIWVGSLFTHLPLETTARWLAHLAKFLTESGIVVATFHGRWSEQVHRVFPYIEEPEWQGILADYRATGFGFRNYRGAGAGTDAAGSYGISLAQPSTVVALVERIPGVRLHLYMERGWADHQDVVVYGRPAADAPWPNLADGQTRAQADPVARAVVRVVEAAAARAGGGPVAVYGAGAFGRRVLEVCANRGVAVGAWFDSDPAKEGSEHLGRTCRRPAAVVEQKHAVFIAASLEFGAGIAARITEEFAAAGEAAPPILVPS